MPAGRRSGEGLGGGTRRLRRCRALGRGRAGAVPASLDEPELPLHAVDGELLGGEGDVHNGGGAGRQAHPREADEHDRLPCLFAVLAHGVDLHPEAACGLDWFL